MYSFITDRLSLNSENLGKVARKISSGLRINVAADDAAGLAISEKLRSQVKGYLKALKNALDAISYVQTADGALEEVHAILHRMREIAVQASNDTNTDVDRAHLNEEYQRLKEEIRRIFMDAEFNTKRIFQPSRVRTVPGEFTVEWSKYKADTGGVVHSLFVSSGGGILVGSDAYIAKYSPDGSPVFKVPSVAVYAVIERPDGVIVAGGDGWIGTTDGKSVNYLSKTLPIKIRSIQILPSGDYLVSGDDSSGAVVAIIDGSGNILKSASLSGSYSPSVKLTSDGGIVVLSYGSGTTYITKLDSSLNEEWEVSVAGDEGFSIHFYSAEVWESSPGTFVAVNSDLSAVRVIITDGSNTEVRAIAPKEISYTSPHTVSIYPTENGGYALIAGAFDEDGKERYWVAVLNESFEMVEEGFVGDGKDHPRKVVVLPDGSLVAGGDSEEYALVKFNYEKYEEPPYVVVQLSPNEGGNMVLDYKGFGELSKLMDSNVLTFENSQKAIELIDAAVDHVNDIRTKLGSYMVRLEKSVGDITNAILNLSSSESVIRDADVAREYLEYTRELVKVSASVNGLVNVKANMERILMLFE